MENDPSAGDGGLDDQAFTAAVTQHGSSLFRFARSLVGSDTAAEDLVQETFLRAYRGREGFRGDASVNTWLRRILHHVAIDRARTPDRELLVEEIEGHWMEDSYTVDPEIVVERAETRAELQDGLARLPFIYRAAVIAHDVEGWTVRELAEMAGIEVPAAKQRLRRGRMLLVSALAHGAERRVALEGVPMRCWDARLLVSDYLDDAVSTSDRATLEDHLSRCPTCPPLYAALVGVHGTLGGLRDSDRVVPPGLAARIERCVVNETAHATHETE